MGGIPEERETIDAVLVGGGGGGGWMLGYLYERFPKYIYFLCAVVIFSLTDACCAFLSSSKLPNVGKKGPNLGKWSSDYKNDNIPKKSNISYIYCLP